MKHAVQWAWNQDLPPRLKLVLLAMAEFGDPNGQSPSGDRMKQVTGLGKAALLTAVEELCRKGLVQYRNHYPHVNCPHLEART